MKHPLLSLGLCFGLCLALVGGASAQVVTPGGNKSDDVMIKIHQIDMINQILPLVLRKEQYNPILTALEKARRDEKKIRELEDADLAKISPKVSDTVKDALEKGAYPNHDTLVEAATLLNAMSLRRKAALGEMIQLVYDATVSVFDAGQKKVMANSIDAAVLDPGMKKDQMTEEQKVKFFIRKVFLDQAAYEILLKLQKTAS